MYVNDYRNAIPLYFRNLHYDVKLARKGIKEIFCSKEDYLKVKHQFRMVVDGIVAKKIQTWIEEKLIYECYRPFFNPFDIYCIPNSDRKIHIKTPFNTAKKWNFAQSLPLLTQISEGKVDNKVESLKEQLKRENPDLESRDKNGNTPLMIALKSLERLHDDSVSKPLIECGKLEAVILLLELGADPNAKNSEGDTPLHICARSPIHKQLVGHFLEIPGIELNAINHKGETPLFCSLFEGGGRKITPDLLMAKGADVTLGRNDEGYNMLHAAIKSANLNCIKQILNEKEELLENPNIYVQTPLDYAVRCSDWQGLQIIEVMKLLLEAGANVNCRDGEDWTPLHTAYNGLRMDVVELLLQYGADINAESKKGVKPLSLSSRLFLHLESEALAKKEREKFSFFFPKKEEAAAPSSLTIEVVKHEMPSAEKGSPVETIEEIGISQDSKETSSIPVTGNDQIARELSIDLTKPSIGLDVRLITTRSAPASKSSSIDLHSIVDNKRNAKPLRIKGKKIFQIAVADSKTSNIPPEMYGKKIFKLAFVGCALAFGLYFTKA